MPVCMLQFGSSVRFMYMCMRVRARVLVLAIINDNHLCAHKSLGGVNKNAIQRMSLQAIAHSCVAAVVILNTQIRYA